MKDIWPVIYAKAGQLAVLLSLIFLIYSSGGFIPHYSTWASRSRREKSHNPDPSGLLGAASALLATH